VNASGEKLPLLVSLPHAGLGVPPDAEPYCILSPRDIEKDGDEGAAEIYTALRERVFAFVTTDVARAIVDLNRAEDDRSKDGVVKTHTCFDVPVHDPFPPEEVVERLLERYHRPFHRRLREAAGAGVELGVDCHTMAAVGPPVAPDPGVERPAVCLSNADVTCPADRFEALCAAFETAFRGFRVARNTPFRGGHIIRTHAGELPWVQVEISRGRFLSNGEKRDRVIRALQDGCRSAG